MSITRRLLLAATSAAGLCALAAWPARGGDFAERLRRIMHHPASAGIVGRIYLAAYPEEASEAVLAQRLGTALALDGTALRELNDAELRLLVSQRMRTDFARGKTVSVDGWILSRTEARLCALWA